MDVCESNQALDTPKPPSFPGKNNGRIQQPLTQEVGSRYKSPTPRRFPSPNTTTTVTPSAPVPNRAVSTRRRHSSPTTPVHDTSLFTELAVRKMTGDNQLQESLWPSRMRSLNVAFQSNTYSMPVTKKEKPPPQAVYDRTLKPSSNVIHKQTLSSSSSLTYRKEATPQRKRSPLKGKNNIGHHHHLENSKPLVDQYRWPSRFGSNVVNKSIDLSDETVRNFTTPNLRRMSLPDDTTNKHQRITNLVSSNTLKKNNGSLPSSPNKSSGGSRGVSPSRSRTMVSAPFRGISPNHMRSSSPSRQLCNSNTTSVLTFISDMKKGKMVANRIEDAHHLRLLYNRQVQWRFVNASSEAMLSSQKLTAEKSLVDAQRTTSQLQDSVAAKRINISQLKLQLKLYLALNQQISYLNQWSLIEREHSFAVNGAIKDLQASTLRWKHGLANIQSVKSAVYSAIQVMQTMGSSMQSTLSRLEEANRRVSELATVAEQERALLDQYESLMTSTSSLQINEYSLRTHLVQLKSI